MSRHGTLGYVYTSTSCCAALSSSAYFTSYPPPLCSWWRSGMCVLFPSGCVQLQLNSCSDVQPWHTCHVPCPPHRCLKLLTNARTPYVLVHMMATHTAFHYELVTQGSGCTCTWSLCHVHFCFSPAGYSLYWVSEMSWRASIVLFIGCSWQALMDLYALKRTSLEATRSPNVRTTPPNDDFTVLFFQEVKWPSTSSGSTVAVISRANTNMPTCLYCTDIRIIISFLAVRID